MSGIKAVPTRINIDVSVNRTRVAADLNLIRQQIQSLQGGGGGNGQMIYIVPNLGLLWNSGIAQVFADLRRARALANIPIRVNTSVAAAGIARLQQQVRALQAQSRLRFTAAALGGLGGGGGGAGGPGFLTGAAQGVGMPFVGNPEAMAGYLAAKGAVESIKTAAEYEAAFATIGRVADLSASQVKDLESRLQALATQRGTATSLRDMVTMADIGARQGVANKGGVEGLAQFTAGLAAIKTIIKDVPVEQLALQTGAVLNNFKLGTEYTVGFGSALAKLDQTTMASASEILNITNRLSGAGQAAGATIEEMMALAATVKQVGISNEVAGTAFSQMFMKMASSSNKFAAMIKVDAKTFEDAIRQGPLVALKMVIDALNDMKDPIEKAQALKSLKLTGARTAGSLLQLGSVFDQIAPRVAEAKGEFTTGAAARTGGGQEAGTVTAAWTRLGSATDALSSTIGSKFAPATATFIAGLTEISTMMKNIVVGRIPNAPAAPPPLPALPPRKTLTPEGVTPVEAADKAMVDADKAAIEAAQQEAAARQGLVQAKQTLDAAMQAAIQGIPLTVAKPGEAAAQLSVAQEAATAATAKAAAAQDAAAKAAQDFADAQAAAAVTAEEFDRQNKLFQSREKAGAIFGAVAEARQGIGRVLAKGVGNALSQLPGLIPEKTPEQPIATGLKGADISRRIQEDVLRSAIKKAEDDSAKKTANNTEKMVGGIAELRDILNAGFNKLAVAAHLN